MVDQKSMTPSTTLSVGPASDQRQEWLSLKDASAFLGVHFTTLRNWADKGEIKVFRTPGGHRRFGSVDLRRFLEERAGQLATRNTGALVEVAIGRVREEIRNLPSGEGHWRQDLDEEANAMRRARGRELFALAIAFMVKPRQRNRIMQEGRVLGWDYGKEAALSNVGLRETGRAVQFFRSQLIQTVSADRNLETLDADDVRIQRLIDQFLDEVLYAVLDGYENHMGGAAKPSAGDIVVDI